MLSQSSTTLSTNLKAVGSQENIRNYLLSPSPESEKQSLETIQKIFNDSLNVRISLVNRHNEPVLFLTRDSIEAKTNIDSIRRLSLEKDSIAVGKIFQAGNTMYYSVTVPVMDAQKKIGHIMVLRRILTSQRTIDQLSQLLGSRAQLFVGNNDRSFWTNLMHAVPDPLPKEAVLTGQPFRYRNAENNKMLGASRPIVNTPWVLLLEFPQDHLLEPANRFLKWLLLIGTLLVFVGIVIAWLMSRNITKPLKKLTAAVSGIASGDYHSSVAVDRRDELGKLARAFNAMTVKVNNAKQALEQKVVETGHMNNQLRELSAHLQNIREEERIHIAREMHDELGQLLTGFKMDVSWLNKKLSESGDPAVQEKLQEMMDLVNEAAKFVRTLASELRPSILDDLGLVPALDWHSQEFMKRSNIDVSFVSTVNELKTTELIATGLFRMYQESLTNIARHADAKKVTTRLEVRNNEISLSITDDGRGFDLDGKSERKTLGLLGMKERATMIGGKLRIHSAPGKGTTVLINVPLFQDITKSPALT